MTDVISVFKFGYKVTYVNNTAIYSICLRFKDQRFVKRILNDAGIPYHTVQILHKRLGLIHRLQVNFVSMDEVEFCKVRVIIKRAAFEVAMARVKIKYYMAGEELNDDLEADKEEVESLPAILATAVEDPIMEELDVEAGMAEANQIMSEVVCTSPDCDNNVLPDWSGRCTACLFEERSEWSQNQ